MHIIFLLANFDYSLGGNKIGLEGAGGLADGLSANSTLTTL